jgi:hypothetical protein
MAIRDPQAQAFSTVIEPNFDGGLIHNDWIKGTIFIKITKAQRNAIGPLFRSLQNDNTTACLVIEDGVIYKLINNPTTQDTTDSDWAPAISVANADTQIIPIGTWDITNTNPVLQDTDANGINGNFYYVQGAPNLTDVTIPGLFQNTTTQVINKDWILSVGTHFVALSNTTTWDNLNRPQSIIDYENGTVIGHTHTLSEVIGLISALAEKYDENDLADMVLDFADVPDSSIGNVAFLRKHFYDKSFVYSKDEVDILLSNKVHNEIPGRDVAGAHPANTISFTPETPSNWEEQPTEVEKGLNLLAEKYINGGSGIPEAPIDGNQYARKDAGWEEVIASGGSGTGVFEPVQDITELKALNTTDGAVWKDKWALIVEDEESWYRYDRDSAVSESLPKIVAPTTGPGRFFQTPDVDLSAKADKTNVLELDNTTEFTPDADYEPATKKYVDDSLPADGSVTNAKLAQEVEDRIAANDAKTTLDVNMTDPILGDPNGSNINLLTQQKYLSVFNGPEISTTFAAVDVFITGINGANRSIEGARLTWYFEITDATIDKFMRFNGSPDPVSFLDYPNWDNATKRLSNLGAGNYKIEGELIGAEWQLEITALAKESILQDGSVTNAKLATEVEDRIAANTSGKADKTNVLELDNTTEFTPDADYEPATKKYVDDNLPDISNKEDRADIITVTDNAGTYELDQDSKRQRLYKTTTSISANKSVDVKNGLEGSVFSWYFQATGTIELDFSASTQTCNSDSSDWATKVLTLAGGTDSKFEIAGLYINGGWNIKVSGEML